MSEALDVSAQELQGLADTLPLSNAFANLEVPDTASVWACGEREDIRQIRHRRTHESHLPPEQMAVFGYWKKGTTNTQIDVARLKAAKQVLATGGGFDDFDDFEIGV